MKKNRFSGSFSVVSIFCAWSWIEKTVDREVDREEYGCQHGVQRRRVCVSMEVGSKPKKVVAKREEGVFKSIAHFTRKITHQGWG